MTQTPTKQPLWIVGGPTASRKSELAMELAQRVGGELVCCDSVQVYRGFVIGSAAPRSAELATVPHHLYGFLDADDPADAGRYARLADAAIADVRGRGRVPILVGGTGLYLRALLWGLAEIPDVPAHIREQLAAEHAAAGIFPLWARLQAADPDMAERIQGGPANTQRVMRALEVVEGTGQRLSAIHDAHQPALRYQPHILVPDFARPVAFARIDRRVDEMMKAGLLDEVRGLLESGVSRDSRPMSALGYRQLAGHLAGEFGLYEAMAQMRQGHRRYSKRQHTWFERINHVTWLEGSSETLADDAMAALEQLP